MTESGLSAASGRKRNSVFCLALFFLTAILPGVSSADIEKSVAKLKVRTYCINASSQLAWEEAGNVLSRLELKLTLADNENRVLTTEFAAADYGQLIKISKNPILGKKGRFTLKIDLEEVTPSFTKIHIVLQVRQNKILGKSERLLKSRGTFEKYIAYQINQRAIARQFPKIGEIKLGASLIPDLKTNRYHLAEVEANSPAGESDLRVGDELLAIDGQEVSIRGELFEILNSVGVEKLAEFKVRRGPRELVKPVWLARAGEGEEKLGLRLKLGAKASGLKVLETVPDSKAQKAGIQPEDLIEEAQGLPLRCWTDFYRMLARWVSGQALSFTIRRGNQSLNLPIS